MENTYICRDCSHRFDEPEETASGLECPKCTSTDFYEVPDNEDYYEQVNREYRESVSEAFKGWG